MAERKGWIDVYKAILIILVVIGHSYTPYYRVIFWFHMPLFFSISGYLFTGSNKISILEYFRKKSKRLLIPWIFYFVILEILPMVLIEHISISKLIKRCVMFLWSGKMWGGVYWYSPVLLLTIMLFIFVSRISTKKQIMLLILSYIIAIMESIYLIPVDNSQIPLWLRFPWNIDVCLISIVYFAIGYYLKKLKITRSCYKWLIVLSVVIAIASVYLMNTNVITFDLNMKYTQYKNFVYPLLFPFIFGIVIKQVSLCLDKIRVVNYLFETCGKASMPIMFIHNPVRAYIMIPVFGESYNIILYTFISCGIGILVYHFFKEKKCKILFGV